MSAALHAVVVWVLLLLLLLGVRVLVVGVVVGVLLLGVGVHGRAAPVAGVGAALDHPAVVGERGEVFAHAVPRVPVAAQEVGEEEEEEDGDDGVADGGAGLEEGGLGFLFYVSGSGVGRTLDHHQLQRPSS